MRHRLWCDICTATLTPPLTQITMIAVPLEDCTPRILIVDDDPHAHFFAQRALRKGAGIEVFIDAWDGDEGIAHLESNPPFGSNRITHVVLDLQMPKLDGFGFLQQFDALPADQTSGVRIVVVSSSPNPDDHARVRKHACVGAIFVKALSPNDCYIVLGTKPLLASKKHKNSQAAKKTGKRRVTSHSR